MTTEQAWDQVEELTRERNELSVAISRLEARRRHVALRADALREQLRLARRPR